MYYCFQSKEGDEGYVYQLHRKRSDGRMKLFSSCEDLRAWTDNECLNYEHFLELMSAGEFLGRPPFGIFGRFIPVPLLFDVLNGKNFFDKKSDEDSFNKSIVEKPEELQKQQQQRQEVRKQEPVQTSMSDKNIFQYLQLLNEAISRLETIDRVVNADDLCLGISEEISVVNTFSAPLCPCETDDIITTNAGSNPDISSSWESSRKSNRRSKRDYADDFDERDDSIRGKCKNKGKSKSGWSKEPVGLVSRNKLNEIPTVVKEETNIFRDKKIGKETISEKLKVEVNKRRSRSNFVSRDNSSSGKSPKTLLKRERSLRDDETGSDLHQENGTRKSSSLKNVYFSSENGKISPCRGKNNSPSPDSKCPCPASIKENHRISLEKQRNEDPVAPKQQTQDLCQYEKRLRALECLEEQVDELHLRAALADYYKQQWLRFSNGDDQKGSRNSCGCSQSFQERTLNVTFEEMSAICAEKDKLKCNVDELLCENMQLKKEMRQLIQDSCETEMELEFELEETKKKLAEYKQHHQVQQNCIFHLQNSVTIQRNEIKRLMEQMKRLARVTKTTSRSSWSEKVISQRSKPPSFCKCRKQVPHYCEEVNENESYMIEQTPSQYRSSFRHYQSR